MTAFSDPIAFFFTIVTYGTWLPGDQRGWIEYQNGWQLPDQVRELEAAAEMAEDACVLSQNQRKQVETQIQETCVHRNWKMHAANCRTNHMHFAIGAHDESPKKIRSDVKAWCTRRLKSQSNQNRENWWADRGSIRWIFTEDELDRVIQYINEAQDRKQMGI